MNISLWQISGLLLQVSTERFFSVSFRSSSFPLFSHKSIMSWSAIPFHTCSAKFSAAPPNDHPLPSYHHDFCARRAFWNSTRTSFFVPSIFSFVFFIVPMGSNKVLGHSVHIFGHRTEWLSPFSVIEQKFVQIGDFFLNVKFKLPTNSVNQHFVAAWWFCSNSLCLHAIRVYHHLSNSKSDSPANMHDRVFFIPTL